MHAPPVRAAARDARWPWRGVAAERLGHGIRQWLARASDGTNSDLFEFDLRANPHLRLELYDQDEDDSAAFDDSAETWNHGVEWAVQHLATRGDGRIVAAWNGPFFSAERTPTGLAGSHVAPVVLRGKSQYNVGSHRWTFGVGYHGGRPEFHVVHLPPFGSLSSKFDFAAGGLQCLVHNGEPLRIAPPPIRGQPSEKGPFASTEIDAGHIPLVDHMKTSRASMGWTRNSRRLYLLFITEPDNETASALALRHGTVDSGGWDLADLQRFWLSLGVWGAVNSDGGDVAQLAFARPDGSYTLIPPRWAAPNERLHVRLPMANTPSGGSLMYWYVRETAGRTGG